MKFWPIIAACLGLLSLTGCTFDVLMRDRMLEMNFKGTSVELSSMTAHSTVELKPYVDARADWKWNVLFVNRREGVIYVLLAVSGRSQTGDTGPCANGAEENLVWLKLDSALIIQDGKSVLIGSCLNNIHNAGNYDIEGRQLTIESVRDSVDGGGGQIKARQIHSNVKYDNDHPEAGLATETREIR